MTRRSPAPEATLQDVALALVDPADAASAALLSALHGAAYAPQREAGWDAAAMASLLASPGVEAHVISLDGKPAGFVMIRRILDEAEIVTLGVVPAFTGLGLARTALEKIIGEMKAKEVHYLFLEVRKDNQRALRLYRGIGFAVIGARKDYYTTLDNHKVDAVCMRFELPVS